jgi:hypothetical protein
VHVKVSTLGHADEESGEFQRVLFCGVEGTHGALLACSGG